MINPDYLMRKSRYIWSTTTKPGWFLFNGYVRHDTETGEEQIFELPDGVYASESPMVPRKGGKSEDDGYLVTFLIDENRSTSECAILDASDIAIGPICRLALPHKISSGVHSTWVEHSQLRADAEFKRSILAAA